MNAENVGMHHIYTGIMSVITDTGRFKSSNQQTLQFFGFLASDREETETTSASLVIRLSYLRMIVIRLKVKVQISDVPFPPLSSYICRLL